MTFIVDITGNILSCLTGQNGIINSIKSNPNYIATGSWDGTCFIWKNGDDFQLVQKLESHKFAVCSEFGADGSLYTSSADGIIRKFSENFKSISTR